MTHVQQGTWVDPCVMRMLLLAPVPLPSQSSRCPLHTLASRHDLMRLISSSYLLSFFFFFEGIFYYSFFLNYLISGQFFFSEFLSLVSCAAAPAALSIQFGP